jgi:short-subunit dehydrogenase
MATPTAIVLTGASSGIGAALARHYAASGVELTLIARREDLLTKLATELQARGARVWVRPADVTGAEAMARIAAELLDRSGAPDLVIANAGVGGKKTLLTTTPEQVATTFGVNVLGVVNTLLPFLPAMVERGTGVVAAVSSMAGHRALPRSSVYSASKAAVITLMDGLRMELRGTGVHAMTLCPGYVRTPMTERVRNKPFLMEPEAAARVMAHAIAQRRRTYSFPWPMRLMRVPLTLLPEWAIGRLAPPDHKR